MIEDFYRLGILRYDNYIRYERHLYLILWGVLRLFFWIFFGEKNDIKVVLETCKESLYVLHLFVGESKSITVLRMLRLTLHVDYSRIVQCLLVKIEIDNKVAS